MKSLKISLPNLTLIILCCFLFVSPGLVAQIKVTRVESQAQLAGKNGVVYALPRTVVITDIYVSKSQQFAGPLAEFAAEIMGIDEVITGDAVSYSIENTVMRTVTEPDPGQVFLVEKEDKSPNEIWISFVKQPPLMILESFNKVMSPDGFSSWNKDLYMTSDPGRIFKKYTDSPTREITDTIIRKVSIDTLVYEEMILRHSREEYSDLEKAQEAADKIRQIEHDKYNLLIGYPETAYSKDALEYMINELEKQRLEYLKLFIGVTVRENLKFSYTIVPEYGRESQEYKISGFTKTNGMMVDEGEHEILLTLKPLKEDVSVDNPADQAVVGIVYQLPGSFLAVLSIHGKELSSKRIEVLQLGTKLTLPSAFKRIEFDLETGALKSVILE